MPHARWIRCWGVIWMVLVSLPALGQVTVQTPRVQPQIVPPTVRPPQVRPPQVRPPQVRPAEVRPPVEVITDPQWPQTRSAGGQRYGGRQSLGRSAREYTRVRPPDGPSALWTVGINLQRAPKGLRVAEVIPRGPANQFGLEVGDYILDVGGYVVGEYQGYYYPLAPALDLATDPSGWAEFLVWNKRTQSEETLWIRLQRRR